MCTRELIPRSCQSRPCQQQLPEAPWWSEHSPTVDSRGFTNSTGHIPIDHLRQQSQQEIMFMGIQLFSPTTIFQPFLLREGEYPHCCYPWLEVTGQVCVPQIICLLCGLPESPGCNLPMLLQLQSQVCRLPTGLAFQLPEPIKNCYRSYNSLPILPPHLYEWQLLPFGLEKHWPLIMQLLQVICHGVCFLFWYLPHCWHG